ncbi:MAG: hypothetical protein PHS59_15390 [Paludibacter sp.]|nr:hypothetical protein [Paludibacter sp.]
MKNILHNLKYSIILIGLIFFTLQLKAQEPINTTNNVCSLELYLDDLEAEFDLVNDDYWSKDWVINVTPNTPVKLSYLMDTNNYLYVYTYENGIYTSYVDIWGLNAGNVTIISTTGKIYVSSEYGWDGNYDDFICSFESSTDLSYPFNANTSLFQKDLIVGGKVGVGVGTPREKLDVNGSAIISDKLGIGSPAYSGYKVRLYNTTETYSLYSYNNRYTTSSTYGLCSYAINNGGNVYGIYSSVGGLTGKKWAGYFTGGDVAVMYGNMGIGTATPIAKIESVTGINTYPATSGTTQSGAALRLRGGDNAVLDFGMNSINTWIQATDQTALGSNYNISLNPNGGNVGIGTKTSATKATVSGTLTVDALGQSVNMYSEGIRLGAASNGYSIVTFAANPAVASGVQANQWWVGKDGRDNGFNIWGNSPGDVFHVLPSGNVGIGTIAPSGKLDVNGELFIGSGSVNLNTTKIFLRNPIGKTWAISSGANMISENNFSIYNWTNNTSSPLLQINETGNVKIGTSATSPTDELLTVFGVIHAKEVQVDLTGSLADFVFHPSYTLMPLNEVEQYVNVNSHLPEMPSAAEVSKNGLNMGEMQNKLLQKIEELTLYVIEQQKRIEMLEKNQK